MKSPIVFQVISTFLLLLLPYCSCSTDIYGVLKLPEAPQKQKTSPLNKLNTTLVTLNDGAYSTYSHSTTGRFTFHNVQPGVYLLDVHSHAYSFSQMKIQILPQDDTTTSNNQHFRVIEYVYPGASKILIDTSKYSQSEPLQLIAHATLNYFEPRPAFSPFVILKNPMVIMMLFSVGLMVVMPKMMEGLDPEQKEQMKKQMEMQQDPSKMLSQMWGDLKEEMGTGGGNAANTGAGEKKKLKKERGKRTKRE